MGNLNGLSTISAYGSDSGYTIVNFILMYVVGAFLCLMDIKVKKRHSAAVCLVSTVVLAFGGSIMPSVVWSYCNPLVILEAVSMFLLFHQINLKNRIINEFSKASFTCFLFHTSILNKYHIQYAVQESTWYMIGHIIFTSVSIYLISYVVYKIWYVLSKPLIKRINSVIVKAKIDFSVVDKEFSR